jgi:hypothetical protein
MESSELSYSKFYYTLIAASAVGILCGGYLTLTSLFTNKEQPERSKSPVLGESTSSTAFENQLKILKNKIKGNQILSEEDTVKIISLIKEYADYLFDQRNKEEYIFERRKLLYNLSKCNIESNEYKMLSKKYEDSCGREYKDLFTFSLSKATRYVRKQLRVKRKILAESWENYSQSEEIYYKVNYYSNLFNNFTYDENEHNIVFIKKLFEEYSDRLIKEVTKIESELSAGNLTNDEYDEKYAERLQYIKLKLSDEIYVQYKIDDKQLKYLAVNVHNLLNIDEKYKILLEKINGIDLISIGF